MSIFKCKMCGGTLEFNSGDTVAVCDSCGSRQTLPRLDDYRRTNLYDRANHFRRNNDFDRAMSIYEKILDEDGADAEAYWSLVLCRYGIEYVEDPATHRRVPTVNRTQLTSVFDDENYQSALHYADTAQREIYREEAEAINGIQKGILAISQQEEPFDVFICYKETDRDGKRTPDSVLANDLYHELTEEGFKVFYSRITLEDKLGTAYEPYIFAALNSAKVMVVIGTRPEHFNAVWVKNEWSRFLGMMKNGAKKALIPAYRDMDPYELPEEFSHLQAQDMSKLGFMQDLIRGIRKIAAEDRPETTGNQAETTTASSGTPNTAPLLKRAFMFLEDRKWAEADEYCEKVLDQDPECARAYLGKLMAELHVSTQEGLVDCEESFAHLDNYRKVLRFGDDSLKSVLNGYIGVINTRNENKRMEAIYKDAVRTMNNAWGEPQFEAAARSFEAILSYKDASDLRERCLERAAESRKNMTYQAAMNEMAKGGESNLEWAEKRFQMIPGWKDADEQLRLCRKKLEEIRARKEAERIAVIKREKRKKWILISLGIFLVAALAFAIVLQNVYLPEVRYKAAQKAVEEENYLAAYRILKELGDYKDVEAKCEEIEPFAYQEMLQTAEVGDFVYYGVYEQDNDTANGKEDIRWLVLAKEDNKILVISENCLDCQPYHTSNKKTTWKNCELRKWLNETFYKDAFDVEEQAKIVPTILLNVGNHIYDINGGKNTKDSVFLLSIDEAEEYFTSDGKRKAAATAYAAAQANEADISYHSWWLRSPGVYRNYAAHVLSEGGIYYYGNLVDCQYEMVRPAMWIDIGE